MNTNTNGRKSPFKEYLKVNFNDPDFPFKPKAEPRPPKPFNSGKALLSSLITALLAGGGTWAVTHNHEYAVTAFCCGLSLLPAAIIMVIAGAIIIEVMT